MESHPEVDLRNHDGYNPRAVESANNDLMKSVLRPPPFPFLEELRSFSRLRTFEEILSSLVDEDLDYHRILDHGLRSALYPEALGLVLVGQPVGTLADLSLEFEEAVREVGRTLEVAEDVSRCSESPSEMGAEQTEEGTPVQAEADTCMAGARVADQLE